MNKKQKINSKNLIKKILKIQKTQIKKSKSKILKIYTPINQQKN